MKTKEYFTPECQIVEMILEGSVLAVSQIGGGEDGDMEEGGEI